MSWIFLRLEARSMMIGIVVGRQAGTSTKGLCVVGKGRVG